MDREDRIRAVDRAYPEHAPDLDRVACAILRDRDAAAEAVQDAFARAFERWARYDPGRPLRAWLVTIVSRVALDAVRRRRVRLSVRPTGAGGWPAGLQGHTIGAIDPSSSGHR